MLAWLVVLAILGAAPAEARTPPEIGIGENSDALFADPRFGALGVRHARVVVQWDVIARADDELARVDRYLGAARAAGVEPLVTFEHSRGDAHACVRRPRLPQCRLPTPGQYERAFAAFRARFPDVRTYAPWNEPNHATQPTWRNPEAAARFTNLAARACPDCTIVVGDLLDQADDRLARRPTYRRTARWVARFRAALRTPRSVCGIHNYSDVNRLRWTGTRMLMRALACDRYWLTETGGIVFSRGLRRDTARQLRATRFLFRRLAGEPRIARVYVYGWFGGANPTWDSGLFGPDGLTRPAYDIVARGVRAGAPRPTTIGAEIQALARDALRSWAAMQTPDSVFPNPVAAEVAAGHGGFAPPMLLYALQREGWVEGAERAWPNAVAPARASAFDMIGAAAAARDLGVPRDEYLTAYVPQATGAYNNLHLVEAVAALAMSDLGLPSPWRAEALRTVNETVPRLAPALLRARGPSGALTGAYLSDPSSHPLAYHALSTLMLVLAYEHLEPAARATLRATLDALSVLVAPDGAADYLGRGQGNVWVPAVTAAALVAGAGLYPERAGAYLAVARVALARLRALHLTADRGLLVVPGARITYDGIDPYVHTVAYNGLALWALAVAADRAAELPPVLGGAAPAHERLQVRDPRSGLAVVGTGRTWMAVRALRRGGNSDLRSGFGLLALKIRDGGGWRDLLAPRPRAKGRPLTPGPLLGSRAPGGTRVRVSSGAIAIDGTYGRGPARFGYRALRDGAELTVEPAAARYRLRIFTPAGTGRAGVRTVTAYGARWHFSAPVRVRRERGWHSAPVEHLDALVVDVRPRGRLAIRITSGTA